MSEDAATAAAIAKGDSEALRQALEKRGEDKPLGEAEMLAIAQVMLGGKDGAEGVMEHLQASISKQQAAADQLAGGNGSTTKGGGGNGGQAKKKAPPPEPAFIDSDDEEPVEEDEPEPYYVSDPTPTPTPPPGRRRQSRRLRWSIIRWARLMASFSSPATCRRW